MRKITDVKTFFTDSIYSKVESFRFVLRVQYVVYARTIYVHYVDHEF